MTNYVPILSKDMSTIGSEIQIICQPDSIEHYMLCALSICRIQSSIICVESDLFVFMISMWTSCDADQKIARNIIIWERIWEKGPIGNFFTNSIPEKIPF